MRSRKKTNSAAFNKTSDTRKDFYKRILIIAGCIIPILLFGADEGSMRLVPLPFFLLGMYQLIMLIQLSPDIVDDFFPPRKTFERTVNRFHKFMYYFASVFFFTSIICLLFEIRQFDNTIRGLRLFWTGGLTGIGIAILLTVILKLVSPGIYDESKRRFTIHAGLFLGCFFMTAAATGFINHFFADKTEFCRNYIIQSKDTSSGRSTEYYFFLEVEEGYEERFSVGSKRYDSFEEGEEIELCMMKGKFGWDVVRKFNKPAG